MASHYSVEVSSASARIGRDRGIAGINFHAAPGEWVSVFGDSGSGKTTLLRMLGGEMRYEGGYVRVLGGPPDRNLAGFGFPNFTGHSSDSLTVSRLLSREAARFGVPAARRSAQSADVVDLLKLQPLLDRLLRDLSSTERAAAILASALVHRPLLLLLDGLDLPTQLRDSVWRYLESRRALEGLTVIHATTSSDEAERADKTLLLDAGRQLAFERPSSLLTLHAADTVTIESTEPTTVQRTLRGVFDVVVTETREGVRYQAADGHAAAAHHFRHPIEGARAIHVLRPSLWDVIATLRTPL